MTIAKGQPWGERAALPADAVLVHDDRSLSRAAETARQAGGPNPVFGVLGGDLCHTIGGDGDLARLCAGATAFPIDLGEVVIDGAPHLFVAHVIARDRFWHHSVVVMNVQWRGEWNLGPKAHPNDGLLDTYQATLSWADRRKVRARLATGSHLPHPRIAAQRGAHLTFDLPRPLTIYVDGEPVATADHFDVRTIPDAIRVIA